MTKLTKHKTSEEEIEFLDKIHCKLPYNNFQECLKLIEQATTISTNALFSVIEEICRIPESERENVSTERLIDLLNLTSNKINHPLKDMIVETAKIMIGKNELTVDDVVLKMHLVKKYPGQFAALSILYFSCDDKEEKLEQIWDNIMNEWDNLTSFQ